MDERLSNGVRNLVDSTVSAALAAELWLEDNLDESRRARLVRGRHAVARGLRRTSGRMEGLAYRVAARTPDPDVDDRVLRDRVSSTLGSVTRRLDVPRVRVSVHDGIVHLDGRVDDAASARVIEQTARGVAGVEEVQTSLVSGLLPGMRPSEAAAGRRSDAFRELVGAVRGLDVGDEHEVQRLVGAVLAVFLDTLPEGERGHVESHLPADVRALTSWALTVGTPEKPRTATEFVRQVADAASRTHGTAVEAARTVLAGLHELVPEEVSDVAAVLPGDLVDFWTEPLTTVVPVPGAAA